LFTRWRASLSLRITSSIPSPRYKADCVSPAEYTFVWLRARDPLIALAMRRWPRERYDSGVGDWRPGYKKVPALVLGPVRVT